jgi:hypothetical protein
MKKLSFFLLLASPFWAMAQKFTTPAIVITRSHDSVRVLLSGKDPGNSSQVDALDPASGKHHMYSISEISGILVGKDNYYQSAVVTIDRSPFNQEIDAAYDTLRQSIDTVLLKREYESSLLKLFSFQDENRMHLFFQKGNGSIQELIFRKYQVSRNGISYDKVENMYADQLSESLEDCPSVVSRIKSISYSIQAVEKVFEKYRTECHTDMTVGYVKNHRSHVDISILAGVSLYAVHYDQGPTSFPGGQQMTAGPSGLLGMRVEYSPSLAGNRLTLVGDLYYNGYNATSSYLANAQDPTYYAKLTNKFKNSYANLALALRYYLNGEKSPLRWFVNAGALYGVQVSANNTIYVENFNNGNQTNSDYTAFQYGVMKASQFGFFGGGGVKFKRYSLEYRFYSYSNVLNPADMSLTSQSHNLAWTYKFNN